MRRTKPEKREMIPDVRYNSTGGAEHDSPHHAARQDERGDHAWFTMRWILLQNKTGRARDGCLEQALRKMLAR